MARNINENEAWIGWKLCHYGDEGGPALLTFKEVSLLPFLENERNDTGKINGKILFSILT